MSEHINAELNRQHQAHLARQRNFAAPQPASKEVVKLRQELAAMTVEHGVLKHSLSQASATISNMVGRISSYEALAAAQQKRIYQLEGLIAKADDGKRSVVSIIKEVLDDYPRVTVDDVCGDSRSAFIVKPRHKAIANVYVERTDLSLVEIGMHFGGRDHTTIMSAVKKMGVWRGEARS